MNEIVIGDRVRAGPELKRSRRRHNTGRVTERFGGILAKVLWTDGTETAAQIHDLIKLEG